jgi:iron(III) transport system substrate-binding protein
MASITLKDYRELEHRFLLHNVRPWTIQSCHCLDTVGLQLRSVMKWLNNFAQAIGCIVLVCLLSAGAHGATQQELIEGARKERELVLYASLTLEEANLILPKFEAKYPFIKVQFARAGSEKLLTRILTEARSKRSFADVIQTVEFSMHTLKNKGVLGRYNPAEGSLYPKDFKENDYWTTFYYHPYVVAYNTNLVQRVRLPKKYDDLLNPAWKNKMMMEGTKVDWFAGMLQIMGKEKGLKFMRELAKQEIILRTGHSLIAQLVAAGEANFDINIPTASVDRLREAGAPIDWIAPGAVPAIMVGVGLTDQPLHPNAARLYVDFVLSKEGQNIIRGFHRLTARSDLAQEQPAAVKDLHIVPVDPKLADHIDDYTKLLREIFSQ